MHAYCYIQMICALSWNLKIHREYFDEEVLLWEYEFTINMRISQTKRASFHVGAQYFFRNVAAKA